ncbi:MAG: DUF6125 family protein [Desulfotomaculales bacterium]
MEALRDDYSGSFRPGISWDNFSRETLLAALKMYSSLFMAVDGFWFLSVKERFGDRTAMACDLWAWDKYIRYELKRITKLFKITGNDVESLLKAIQLSPWGGNLKFEAELRDKNHGFLRVIDCPTLQAIAKEGQGRENYFCREVESVMFEMYARYFDPEIKARPLKLPPQTLGSAVCCEWELKKE